jgi:xylulokinase
MHAKPGSALFLGIELSTDQLRATLLDDSLDLVAVECVDFDAELPEYGSVLPPSLSRVSRVIHLGCRASHRSCALSSLVLIASPLFRSHRTQGGIFTTPGEAYTAPIDMWIRATGE